MSLIKKINSLYKSQILNDLVNSKNYKEFFLELEKLSQNKNSYPDSTPSLVSRAISDYENDFEKKIIWLNSFDYDDLNYINNFLNFYLAKLYNLKNKINTYEDSILNIFNSTDLLRNLSFNDFVNFSYFYQWNIINSNQNPLNFLNNQMPFFSTRNNFNFTKPSLTQCYIYIVDHPYSTYQKIKNNNDQDSDIAKSIFLNLDNSPTIYDAQGVKVEINKQGWHTHVSSWRDANVRNSLKGKFILKSDLIKNPYEALSSIIFHFIQSGANLDMNYEIVEEFINLNKNNNQILDIKISNKEKKFLDRHIGDLISEIESIELE